MAPKPAAAAKKPAAKVATVTLKQLAAGLAEGHKVPKKQAEGMLNDMVATITKRLKKGENGPRHPSGPRPAGPHGSQPGDGRGHQDQGEQEDRLPRRQGAEGSDLIAPAG